MAYRFSLAYLTVCDITPPAAVAVAAEAGYDLVGFRLLPSTGSGSFPLMTDDRLLKETLAAMKDTGVMLADIEIIRIGEHFKVSDTQAFLERGRRLGAGNVLVAGDDPNEERMIESFGQFCDLAGQYELTADLEFMPWTEVQNVSKAQRIVQAVNCSNAGVLVDALHFSRSDSSLEDLAGLPSALIHYVQMNDALDDYRRESWEGTVKAMIYNARDERGYPGEGSIDLVSMLAQLPRDTVLSLEIPRLPMLGRESPLYRAQHAIDTTRSILDRLPPCSTCRSQTGGSG
jgi:sugar phosphate isomerase/epimerase